MAKTASVYARVDPETKEQAEAILEELGLPMSVCIEMMLKQMIRQRKLPFQVTLNTKRPLVYEELSEEEFHDEIQKGLDDIAAGRVYSQEEILDELNRGFGA